jgi:hypothetical protein
MKIGQPNLSERETQKSGLFNTPTNVLFSIVQNADDYRLKKWMKGESNSWHWLISKFVIKTIDLAEFTILMDAYQDFTLSVIHLPAWSFGIK